MIETVKRALGADATPEGVAPPQIMLEMDVVLDLIRNQRRRRIISIVATSNGPIDVRELAKTLAAIETGKSPPDMTSEDYKATYVGVYQTHAPKLAEHGVVAIDRDGVEPNTDPEVPKVVATPMTGPVDDLIRLVQESTIGGNDQ